MATSTTFKVSKRRKREGKTNYKKRLGLLLSRTPRAVVRKSHNNCTFQIIGYETTGDKALAAAHSKELKKYGYEGHGGNARAGYLAGYLCAKKALNSGVKKAILDIGMVQPVKGSTIFAILAGALDGGLDIPHNPDILPAKEKFDDLKNITKKINGE